MKNNDSELPPDSRLKKFKKIISSNFYLVARIWHVSSSVGGVVFWLSRPFIFIVVTASPLLFKFGISGGTIGVIAIIGAGTAYLQFAPPLVAYLEKGGVRGLTEKRRQKVHKQVIHLRDGLIHELDESQIERIRSEVLDCVVVAIQDKFSVPINNRELTANLLLFQGSPQQRVDLFDASKLEVVARSPNSSERDDLEYTLGDTVSGEAIKCAIYQIEHDIKNTSKYAALYQRRKYRTCAAFPLIHNKKIWGALSIDYTSPYVFKWRKLALEAEIKPYEALLLTTIGRNTPYADVPT